MTPVLIAAWLATAPIEVVAEGACPRGEEVVRHFARLVPVGMRPARVAEVRDAGAGLQVRLYDRDGTLVQEKTLTGFACAERAEAVAVVLATWDARLGASLAPAPMVAPAVVEVVAAGYLGVDRAALAPGLRAGIRVRSGAWGLALGALIVGPEAQALGEGQVRWGRAALELGPALSVARGRWIAGGEATVLAGALLARGAGFAASATRGGFDVGAQVGASFGRQTGPVVPFVALSLTGWARPHQLEVAGAGATAVPRLQVLLGAGAVFGAQGGAR